MSLLQTLHRWLRAPASAFTSSAMVILGVVAISMVLTHFFLVTQVQQPRVQRVSATVAAYIQSVRAFAQTATPEQRQVFFDSLGGVSPSTVHVVDGSQANFQQPGDALLSDFLTQVQAASPGGRVAWHAGQSNEDQALWFEVLTPDGLPSWISFPARETLRSPLALALLVGALLLLALAAAAWLHTGLTSQLRTLGESVERLGRGEPQRELTPQGTTEVAHVNKLLHSVTQHLREAEHDREVLLAGISHDLRTLLTKLRLGLAVRGSASDKASDKASDSAPDDASLVRTVNQIDAIVGQFLDFAIAGNSPEAALPLNLNEIVSEAAATMELDGHPVALHLQTLPPVRARPVVLQRVMANLLGNAARYSGQGLAVSTSVEGGQVCIRVSDGGPGVSIGELERLGKPFFRTDAGRTKGPGSGLGLAIVHRLLKAEGGSLELSINDFRGLDASVRLPAVSP